MKTSGKFIANRAAALVLELRRHMELR
jgi:hypothetical protein